MRKRFQSAVLFSALALTAASLLSCPNLFSDQDIKAQIKQDVVVATANVLTLTIESDPNGITTPSGAQSIKEGVPVDISTTPFATHAFTGWTQTGGTGTAAFEDASLSATKVTVTGGSASIKPVLQIKPKVLYSTPIGADIPKNSRVTVVFSKNIDPATVSATTLTITENGSGPTLGGQFTVTANMIRFSPNSPFNAYKTYVINATADIRDTDGVALIENYTSAFKTGNTFDNEPPANGTFIINDGTATHTATRSVTLNNIFADDDSEIPTVRIYDESGFADQYLDFSASIPWTLSPDDGEKIVYMKFQDQIGNETPDAVTKSIILDTTPPSGSVLIEAGADFTNSASVTLTLDALDPASGTKDGSGMAGGQMMISNDSGFDGASWEAYAATKAWNLASGDGTKTVYVKFMDAIGNAATTAVSDSIVLDATAPTGTINGGVTVATNSTSVTVTLELTDGSGSGVDTVQLTGSDAADGAWTSSSGNYGNVVSGAFEFATPAAASFSFTLSPAANIDKTVSFTVKDKLGNSRTLTGAIRYDTSAPTLTGIAINGGAADTNSAAVTVAINGAADANGGTITHVGLVNEDAGFASPTWIPFAASVSWTLEEVDGTKTVYVKLRDAAGNVTGSAEPDSINLNTAAPDGQFVIAGNATYSKTTAVTINSTSSTAAQMRFSNDGTNWSAWTAYSASAAWTLVSGDGSKTVYGQYKNDLGTEGPVVSDTIILDAAAPTGAITILGTGDGTNAYTNTLTVSLALSYEDALSGPYRMRFATQDPSVDAGRWSAYQSLTTLQAGFALANPSGSTYQVYYQVLDKAGNTSPIYSDSIVYDNAVPSISAFSINSGAAWTNNSAVTLNSTVTDATSGVYQLSVSNTSATAGFSAWETYSAARAAWTVLNPTTDGSKQVWIKVRDKAGNESTVATDTIGLDKTVPGITAVALNAGATTTPSLQAQVTITSSDGGSGLSQYQLYYNGTYGTWKTLSGSPATVAVDWPFTTNPGTHYVYVSVKDAAGNVSGWTSDTITLEVPAPLYAMKGIYSGGYTYVYGSTVQAPSGTNTYYIYSTTNSAANPNVDPSGLTQVGSASGSTYTYPNEFQAYATSPAGELRYFFVRAYNAATGGYGPYSAASASGWSSHVTIIYDATDSTDTALAQALKTRIETDLPSSYPTSITGTQPVKKAILIPETMVATSFVAGTTPEAYYRHVIYGDPTIVTPSTSVYANANQTRNLVSGTRGVFGMGYGGTKLIDTVNSYWTTWGLSGTQPANIGYLNSATFTASTLNAYMWNTSNTVWTSPLTSTSLPGTDGSTQFTYATMPLTTRYDVYRLNGAAMTGGWLYARETDNANYFPVAHQGRFLHWGYTVLPDRPYTGITFFVNLIARMDDY